LQRTPGEQRRPRRRHHRAVPADQRAQRAPDRQNF
jgi:hypothetical protein